MDWLRRNWPDLAIGVALVGVIAGIVATLITGGSFFPVGPTTQPPGADPPSLNAAVNPDDDAAPDAADPPAAGDAGVGPAADGAATPGAAPGPVGAVSVLTPEGADPNDAAAPGGLAAPASTPPADGAADAPNAVDATEPAADDAADPLAPAVPPQPVADAPAAATPAATVPDAGPLPSAAGDADAPFRVSVGAFGNAENAERLATTFRNAGYPVFTGVQGDLTIVLVGPYAAEGDADRVAARIANGGFGISPVVYRFRPDAPTPGASTPAPQAATPAPQAATPAPQAATPAPQAATPAPQAEPAPADVPATIETSASGRSLQVGAFADAASARPLQDRLAAVGLSAFEVREDGLTKLLVGPFDAEGLAVARSRLAELGIESFPR